MKLLIGLIFTAFVLQALAMPAVEEAQTSEVKPKNDVVDAFRDEINRWFAQYQTFYDRTNAALKTYRLLHVELVESIYNQMMTVLGNSIDTVRMLAYDLDDLLDARIQEVGMNQCLQNIMDERDQNAALVGRNIQGCALTANTTLSTLLAEVFYPTFAEVQVQTSQVPISVIDVLSRGNVLEDEQAILQYLEDRYAVYEMQWLSLVSQLLRWDSNRFETEGLFKVDEIDICMAQGTEQYLLTMSRLEGEVQNC
ncbi:CLUMA_CG008619, isoform A [Clunio marinus]|uniref:CLUMA_CG008619, isoform A n=1 Tax=Clunio marinus TaxID=568069 RepID=A0A1J1I4C6_9DIPT|nr:CLUMA_CG008619, isoform A [Clunio marinus]